MTAPTTYPSTPHRPLVSKPKPPHTIPQPYMHLHTHAPEPAPLAPTPSAQSTLTPSSAPIPVSPIPAQPPSNKRCLRARTGECAVCRHQEAIGEYAGLFHHIKQPTNDAKNSGCALASFALFG
ncbi:hypothetical protein BDV95DRAFT_287208 [Massariosphaeria phaeospora]|uniref:Uncharacterized protein n=1 Tax=Massariosphaeria phaeospora TaxID=100035 RepID=A0A7C8IC58_9PLEO|nr:hypothetical protein BDV95DRAFT_287208 [Massariosphaeria phaeospora]